MKTAAFKHIFSVFLLGFSVLGLAQENFSFKRKIQPNLSTEWNQIEIPMSMHQRLNQNLSDIRIYQITDKDTLETPYITLRDNHPFVHYPHEEYAEFKITNRSKTTEGQYITLQGPISEIEQITLNFSNENFDWKINLEGSHDQKKWFTILENYRILSIKTPNANYNFQKLLFSKSKYEYYRIFIPTEETLNLIKAIPELEFVQFTDFNTLKINKLTQRDNKKEKHSVIDISLPHRMSVLSLILDIDETEVFSRKIQIKYLIDSTKTEKGWIKNYGDFYTGLIRYTGEKQTYDYSNNDNIWAKDFRIIIENEDNTPLKIKSIEAQIPKYYIYFKPKSAENYFLFYGDKNASEPKYDLDLVANQVIKLPKIDASLGDEENIPKEKKIPTEPLFSNKWWLWGIILLIISILGYFSYKMLNTEK